MKTAKASVGRAVRNKASAKRTPPQTPVDMDGLRREIADLVGGRAVEMVEITISEAEGGHPAAMKYLFEMIGLYPATAQTESPEVDSLARTLLRHLGLPEGYGLETSGPETCRPETKVTKDSQAESGVDGDDAVK
jgi:hypothetical protein